MGSKKQNGGGSNAVSGFIYQTLYAIMVSMEDDRWDRIKVEPLSSNEKIDILLIANNPLTEKKEYYKKIQVKKRSKYVSEGQLDRWIEELVYDDKAENYELCLFGETSARKKYRHRDNVKIYDNDIAAVETEAKEAIARYCKELKAKGFNKRDLEIAYRGLFFRLIMNSIEENSIGKDQVNQELKDILKHSLENCVAYIKYTSKRLFIENPTYNRDLSPNRLSADGKTVLRTEDLPKLSCEEFPKVTSLINYTLEKDDSEILKNDLFEYFENNSEKDTSQLRHIFLSAKSGGGKSTYMYGMWEKYLFKDEKYIPLYVALKDVTVSIKKYIEDHYFPFEGKISFDWLKSQDFKDSAYHVLLLLDGYNEILDDSDENLKAEIKQILCFEKVTVIVTSRSPKSPFDEGTMTNLKLCDLTREQIRAFLGGNEDYLPEKNYEGMLNNPFMLEICIKAFADDGKEFFKNINLISMEEVFKEYIDQLINDNTLSPVNRIYIDVILPVVAMKLDVFLHGKEGKEAEKVRKDPIQYDGEVFEDIVREVQKECDKYRNLMNKHIPSNDEQDYISLIKKNHNAAKRVLDNGVKLELFRCDSSLTKNVIWEHEIYRDYFIARGYAIYCAYNEDSEDYVYNLAKQINYRYPEPGKKLCPVTDELTREYHVRKIQMFIDMVDTRNTGHLDWKLEKFDKMKKTAVYRRLTRDIAFVYEDLDNIKMAESAELSLKYYSSDLKAYAPGSKYDYQDLDRRYADAAYSISGLAYNYVHNNVPADKKEDYVKRAEKELDRADEIFENLEKSGSEALENLTVRDDRVKKQGNRAAYYFAISRTISDKNKKKWCYEEAKRLHEENLVERGKIKETIVNRGLDTRDINNSIAQTYTGIASADFWLGAYDEAIAKHEKAIELRPDDAYQVIYTAYANIIGCYARKDEYQEGDIIKALHYIEIAYKSANDHNIFKSFNDLAKKVERIMGKLTDEQKKDYKEIIDRIKKERRDLESKSYNSILRFKEKNNG